MLAANESTQKTVAMSMGDYFVLSELCLDAFYLKVLNYQVSPKKIMYL